MSVYFDKATYVMFMVACSHALSFNNCTRYMVSLMKDI